MPRSLRTIVPPLLIMTSLLALAPAAPPRSPQEDVQKSFVTNFPQTQQVADMVAIDGVVRHATLQHLRSS